jgi:acyl-CoA synthetase (AMP-forming)/AMP-acid ligase II
MEIRQRASSAFAEHARSEQAVVCRVISQHQRLLYTYDLLDRESSAVARGLRELGVAKGSRVAVSLGNNIEYATVRQRLD